MEKRAAGQDQGNMVSSEADIGLFENKHRSRSVARLGDESRST